MTSIVAHWARPAQALRSHGIVAARTPHRAVSELDAPCRLGETDVVHDSISANRPCQDLSHGGFEIWFLVVFERESGRAYWLRFTRFAPEPGHAGTACAMVWAAAFHRDAPPMAEKAILDAAAFVDHSSSSSFEIQIGDASRAGWGVLGHGVCRGAVSTMSWDLTFEPDQHVSHRFPQIFARLPLPTHSELAHAAVPFSGHVVVDGERRELESAVGLQMHIHGRRRVEELFWVCAPHVGLEVTGVRAKQRLLGREVPRLTSLSWEAEGHPGFDACNMSELLTNRFRRLDPPGTAGGDAILEATSATALRRARVRAYAPHRDFVGYRYRDPQGSDVFVAQSDVATIAAELFERDSLVGKWRLVHELRLAQGGAMELHATTPPLGDLHYVGWEEEHFEPITSPEVEPEPDRVSTLGKPEPLPAPKRVFALGVTYAEHARETGENPHDPAVFVKDASSFQPRGGVVVIPDRAALDEALDALEPGLAAAAAREIGVVPALMDYEVELGVYLLEGVTRADLARGKVPRAGFFLAADLTARAVQVLGEGTADRMAFWGRSKSFSGFLPTTSSMFVPDEPVRALPRVTLETHVNGALRQRESTQAMALDLVDGLRRVAERLDLDFETGDVLLTGTPSGVALATPRWKKAIADRVLDRFGKLAAVIDGYAAHDRFLRPGDEVRFSADGLGTFTVQLSVGCPSS